MGYLENFDDVLHFSIARVLNLAYDLVMANMAPVDLLRSERLALELARTAMARALGRYDTVGRTPKTELAVRETAAAFQAVQRRVVAALRAARVHGGLEVAL